MNSCRWELFGGNFPGGSSCPRQELPGGICPGGNNLGKLSGGRLSRERSSGLRSHKNKESEG